MQKKMLIMMMMFYSFFLPGCIAVDTSIYQFTEKDKAFLAQFSLNKLPALPLSPDNAVADNIQAAQLGKQLFFDARLSKKKLFSCASCHKPNKYFTDGLPRSVALGTTRRSAPSLLGSPWSPWLFWDGRKDSLWSQALGPIEHPDEQGISRTQVAVLITQHYQDQYQRVFGDLPNINALTKITPDASPLGNEQSKKNWQSLPKITQEHINRVFSNIGKALMAYQRQLKIPPSRFDHFVDTLMEDNVAKQSYRIFNETEVKGLRLFMGKANCASCHNGPLFTNFEFHNIGAPEPDKTQVDMGRFEGVVALVNDEFTCLSKWSDASEQACEELLFLKRKGPELVGAFKTPTLRNVAATAPYMQSGQFDTLVQVLNHYNKPKPPFYDRNQHPSRPHFDVLPLQLSENEIQQIIAFLNTLTSPLPDNDPWWKKISH